MTKYKIINNIKTEMTADEITALETAQTQAQTEINAEKQKIQEATNKKASGKQKLKDLGLDDDEIKALIGA
jgi:hypothetical protein